MTRVYVRIAMGLVTVLMLASCGTNAKSTLGLTKTAPDEFRVIAKSPLSIPPNFSLRPPAAAAATTTDQAGQTAQGILLGQPVDATHASLSSGEENFLNKSNVKAADPAIRQALAADNAPPPPPEKKPGFLTKILPSDAKKEIIAPDAVVDAVAEKERLDQNKKEGKPVTEGETPTISNQPSTLDKLLGNTKKE